MAMTLPVCPSPPDWRIDWPTLERLSWLQEMRGCPQHPVRHAEGDVWTHVHMVCEAMAGLPQWRALPPAERELLFAAALLHDVAKPACTRVESDGSVSARGHAWRGAIRARYILWRRGVPFAVREQIAALVRHHLVPFYLVESRDPRHLAVQVSQTARCDHLAILATADAMGRACPDPERLLEQIAGFRDLCAATGCLGRPFPFKSDDARFEYFQEATGPGDGPEVTLLSGLPAAGKDAWLGREANGTRVIGLDDLRDEMGLAPNEPQAAVVQRAREIATDLLRAGRPFVWNAVNINRHVRGEAVRLFAGHGARVRIVYLEVPYEQLMRQNRGRRRMLPLRVMERYFDKWEVPDRLEAHRVELVVEEATDAGVAGS